MNTALAKTKEKFGTIRDLLQSRQSEIAAALPRHLDARRMVQVALGALRTNPALLDCSHGSLLSSIMTASQLGLELDGVLGQAYLVPYGRECTMQIGYRGLIDLARRSGQIKSIRARVVRVGDTFSYRYGLREDLEHVPSGNTEGEITHVYAVAELMDGGFAMEVMSKNEVEQVRKSAKSGNRGPWVTAWPEMSKKTVIRRLAKMLPLSTSVLRAVVTEEYAEAGILPPAEVVTPDGEIVEHVVDADSIADQFSGDANEDA